MSKPRIGSGKRFDDLVADIKKSGKSDESAKKIAASIGRKKYGDSRMNKMAKTGAKRAARRSR